MSELVDEPLDSFVARTVDRKLPVRRWVNPKQSSNVVMIPTEIPRVKVSNKGHGASTGEGQERTSPWQIQSGHLATSEQISWGAQLGHTGVLALIKIEVQIVRRNSGAEA